MGLDDFKTDYEAEVVHPENIRPSATTQYMIKLLEQIEINTRK